MTIGEMLKQGFHYARTCKSLWLFGFFLGLTSGGSSSGGGGGQGGGVSIGAAGVAIGTGRGLPFGLSPSLLGAIVVAVARTEIPRARKYDGPPKIAPSAARIAG